jgi:hypothetical protein
MAQLVGRRCVACRQRIGWVCDGRFCPACGAPTHDECAKAAVEGSCPQCGSLRRRKPEPAPADAAGSAQAGRRLLIGSLVALTPLV